MIPISLAFLAVFAFCLIFCRIVYQGMAEGKVMARSYTYDLRGQPILFWPFIVLYLLVIAMSLALMTFIATVAINSGIKF